MNIRKSFLIIIICCLLLLLISTSFGQAKNNIVVNVQESNNRKSVIRFEIGSFEKEEVKINNESYYKIKCPKEGVILNAGEPELPYISRSIIIPDDAAVKVKVLTAEYEDISNIAIIPSKGNLLRNINPDKVPYSFGPVYKSNKWYPEQMVEIGEPYILRDFRGVVIRLNAFQYNPVKKMLRVYKNVTIEVANTGQDKKNILKRPKKNARPNIDFDNIYRSNFINYDSVQAIQTTQITALADAGTSVEENGEMLVIAYDDFYNDMLPFVEWKKQKGIPTTIVKRSVVSASNNATEIKNYIQNYYNTNPNLCYVLLVGDIDQMASPTVGADASDATYAKVAGSDNYPDILVGRFSAETSADTQTQVQRSISYERDAQAGVSWYKAAIGIASAENSGSESDIQHMDHIRNDLLSFTYTVVDRIYDPNASASSVTTALNQGRSFVNYCGHGSETYWWTTGFHTVDVSNLANTGKLPYIISVSCLSGAFHTGTCFAEAWLRSQSSGQSIGAVAAYMSTNLQPWVPPMIAQDQAVDLLIARSKTTFGGLCYNGSIKMLDTQGTEGVDTFDHWVVFGDPSLMVYTDTPGILSVSHAGAISPSATGYIVQVAGVSGALCALYYNGTLYGSAYTGADGSVNIPISQSLPSGQTLKLTVTAFNKLPKIDNVVVGGTAPTPTSTSTPTATNTPTPSSGIVLSIDGNVLTWTDSAGGNNYHVYKNGGWLAWTSNRTYTISGAVSGDIFYVTNGDGSVQSNTVTYGYVSPTATNTNTPTSSGVTPTATNTNTNTNTPTPSGVTPTATITPTPSGGAPAWQPNTYYAVNAQVTYGGQTYKCLQAHTSQVGWEPPYTPALWQLI